MATLKQLRALVAIVDLGTFEAAAQRLGIAQSAVSRQIQDLEEWFGFALFDRSGRAARITFEAGEVIDQARKVLLQYDVLESSLMSNEVLSRHLRIGITELSALTWLPRFVATMAEKYPRVRVEPEVELSVRLKDSLINGQLDLIVVPDAFSHNGVIKSPLGEVLNGWYAAPSLAPPEGKVELTELSRFTLLAQGNLSGSGVLMEEWLSTQNLKPVSLIPSNSLVALVGLTISGLGISYLPHCIASGFVDAGRLCEIQTVPSLPTVNYVALVRADTYSPFYRAVVQIAKVTCQFTEAFMGATAGPAQKGNQ
ncbi:DNA-binding transcriptional regulator, LysR family [Pseudomonas asplenii]|uniref:DNA-binding transcriptional regulator, LysR family n=1 Tax=Pseudomonas asplenii TaxID=53407 RepID=A0A1H1X3U0_9PSED|nr:LysR family transcriptional regulator [Pseudomonas asplenii]SDT04025.1 DNA-binding transcriptional regulator, LysR family [Pseudomonas asplenii]